MNQLKKSVAALVFFLVAIQSIAQNTKIQSDADYDFKMLTAVMSVNEKQKLALLPKIKTHFKNNLKGKRTRAYEMNK